MSPAWNAALAFALTGDRLDLAHSEQPEIDVLVTELADRGWTRDRLAAHARKVATDEQPWPHPVPTELRSGCGAAQFQAALNRARAALDLVTLETLPPSTRARLNADEERLLREKPPHHGS